MPSNPFATPAAAHMHTPAQIAHLIAAAGHTHAPAASSPSAANYNNTFIESISDQGGPFSVSNQNFGFGMFTEQANCSAGDGPLHFPSIAASLMRDGFTRSAGVLLECALTFHAQGMDSTRGNKPEFKPYRASAADQSVIPPPAALAMFGQHCLASNDFKRASQYLKTALFEFAKLKKSPAHATNPLVQSMNILSSPEREWTFSLIEAHLGTQDEAQAQKLLELRYNCMIANPSQATAMPSKYLLLLARLYATPPQQTSPAVIQSYTIHNPRAAIAIHTRLLQLQPFALESALDLIKLQVDPRPIVAQSLATHYPLVGFTSAAQASQLQQQSSWLNCFLTSHWRMAQGQYPEAISTDEGGLNFMINIAPRSSVLIEAKAHLQLACADDQLAMKTLERMHAIDPYNVNSMDLLALLYTRAGGKQKELATLMAHCLRVDECRSESWSVAACSSAATGAKEKSQKYIEKAILLAGKTAIASKDSTALTIASIIRGTHHLEWEKASIAEKRASNPNVPPSASPHLEQAQLSFRKATLLQPSNSLATMGLAMSYVLHAQLASHANPNTLSQHASYKTGLALVTAPANAPLNSKNPRLQTNCGLVLAQAHDQRQKAAKMLHRAMTLDPDYSEAVIALADMYCASQQYPDALNMLLVHTKKVQAHLASGGSPVIAQLMLGSRDYLLVKIAQVHAMKGEVAEAMQYYKQALAANSGCTAALEGIAKLEENARAALDAEMGISQENEEE
ncbi:MAG: tetratricopeptide repeat protein [Dehalococcoidales bacterium]|nr:tetratricopeptide repeat protein [Dehalococcoidales bacterium]